jgi:hypothetical protein
MLYAAAGLICLVYADTKRFDGDAFMLDGLPAWTAHLEYQEHCGSSPGPALH